MPSAARKAARCCSLYRAGSFPRTEPVEPMKVSPGVGGWSPVVRHRCPVHGPQEVDADAAGPGPCVQAGDGTLEVLSIGRLLRGYKFVPEQLNVLGRPPDVLGHDV